MVALGMGMTMVGATIMGGAAAPLLQTYPENFAPAVTGVTGSNAQPADILALTDIVSGIGSYNVDVARGAAAAQAISEGEFTHITESGVPLLIGSTTASTGTFLGLVDADLNENDLPVTLADSQWGDNEGNNDQEVKYDAKIEFSTSQGFKPAFAQDDQDFPLAGPVLFADNNDQLFTLTWTAQENFDYDNTSSTTINADLEGVELDLLGLRYTVVSATGTGSPISLTKLVMLGGGTRRTFSP